MAEKKCLSRFCIQFNESDSRHLQAMEILNEQGRHKAQFVANAILHYINCENTPAVPQDDAVFKQAVEAMVTEFLRKQSRPAGSQPSCKTETAPAKKIRQSAEIGVDNTGLDDSTIEAINDTLAAFRSMGDE